MRLKTRLDNHCLTGHLGKVRALDYTSEKTSTVQSMSWLYHGRFLDLVPVWNEDFIEFNHRFVRWVLVRIVLFWLCLFAQWTKMLSLRIHQIFIQTWWPNSSFHKLRSSKCPTSYYCKFWQLVPFHSFRNV